MSLLELRRSAPSASTPADAGTAEASRAEQWSARTTAWSAVAVLVLSTGAFVTVLVPEGDSSRLVQLVWLSAYGVAALCLLDGLLRQRTPLVVPAALWGYVLLAGASTLWSDAPAVTVRRTVALVGTILVALVLAQRLRPAEVFDVLRRAMLIVVVASLLFYLSGDARALDDVHLTLRGVVSTKNSLGRVAAVGLLAAAATAFLDRRRTTRCAVSALPMLGALALTDSAGGALTAVLGLGLIAGAALTQARVGRVLLAATALLALGAVALSVPGASSASPAALVGRDASLTGRTELWSLSIEAAADRPLLGYGYGAFWHPGRPEGSPESVQISEAVGFDVPHAHNGLIDAALGLGLLGVLISLLLVTGLLARGLRDARDGRAASAMLRLLIGVLVIVSNIAESSFLRENALLTLLFVIALAHPRPGRAAATAAA